MTPKGNMSIVCGMDTGLTARERLAQWVERSKLSQVEAARLIGIDKGQFNQILLGRRRPGLDNAVLIEAKTGIVVAAWVPIAEDEIEEPAEPIVENVHVDKA